MPSPQTISCIVEEGNSAVDYQVLAKIDTSGIIQTKAIDAWNQKIIYDWRIGGYGNDTSEGLSVIASNTGVLAAALAGVGSDRHTNRCVANWQY